MIAYIGKLTPEQEANKRIAKIRTTDRISFKQCRRKWDLSSHLRQNLQQKQMAKPLWLGTAVHYALEDYHGYNRYGSPAMALQAFGYAYKKGNPNRLPDDFIDLMTLGTDMMTYYTMWEEDRQEWPTYIVDGKPQVEVSFKIPIPKELIVGHENLPYDEIYYVGQIDRVAIDENGALWVVEYKTAAQFETNHYLNDPQCSAYMWAMGLIYDLPIAGIIYQQHKKDVPAGPRVLKNGSISTAMNQGTTHRAFRYGLTQIYPDISMAPAEAITMLNRLAAEEQPDADKFIRRDKVYRNENMAKAEERKILMEAADMLNPNLPLYPAPTRQCAYMCNHLDVCVSMDDGSDWEHQLALETEPRPEEYDGWRVHLPAPETFTGLIL